MKQHTNFVVRKHAFFIALIFLVSMLFLVLAELALRIFLGLGNPVLYDSSPIYGFRPLPNKKYTRFWGTSIRFNNLGLRTEQDWDGSKDNKILFLGDSVTYGGSYLDTHNLFAHLTVNLLNDAVDGDYQGGNAGVNAWGIENMANFILEAHFLPASMYVTTVPEGDFYRGLTRIQGLPFFNVKPRFAWQELWYFLCYTQNNKRYRAWTSFASEDEKLYIVEKAVKRLGEMDRFLKKQGYIHLLCISPSKSQVLGEKNQKDVTVQALLEKYQISAFYIADAIAVFPLSSQEKALLFYDHIHLNKQGHELWAKIIAARLKAVPGL